MKRHLLDVNVLLALLWPLHEHHATAHGWFGRTGQKSWATNPLTQLGVLRLLTNPAITQGAVSATAALDVLHRATRHAGHEFWPLARPLPAALKPHAAHLAGHRQWTGTLLLWHAADRDGMLVTFDAGLKETARGMGDRVLVLKSA